MARTKTGRVALKRLMPEALMAISSLSAESRPKETRVAIKKAIGRATGINERANKKIIFKLINIETLWAIKNCNNLRT